MAEEWVRLLARWTDAGLVDDETAARIRAFESTHAGSTRLRWPVIVALAFGAIMLGAGVLLFVSAHWDALSPSARVGLVILLVAIFHIAGAVVADRFPGMSATLHAIGTVALGAGIFLAGQIFNLDEHWPGGVMLWALGAAIGWLLLRQAPQLAFAAILIPAWLGSEWIVAVEHTTEERGFRVVASGVFLLALTYFTATRGTSTSIPRMVFLWVGGIALLPAAFLLAEASSSQTWTGAPTRAVPIALLTIGWTIAIGLPLAVAAATRGIAAWPHAIAAGWVVALVALGSIDNEVLLYTWWALGATALVAWGVYEGRSERINMGATLFAATIGAFYFSEVMDKLGRSASLIGLGLLCLGGGWALERIRRRLILQARGLA